MGPVFEIDGMEYEGDVGDTFVFGNDVEKLGVKFFDNDDRNRAGDFPHQVFFRGGIAELDFKPGAGVWILEIQIRHPTPPFGAFYEDSLV